MKRLLFLILFLTVGQVAISNNVRISGEPVVQLNTTSDSLSLKFILSWDNSWRDDFNWDAVWLFVKYRKEGSSDAWSHLYLSPAQSGSANLEIDPGNTGDKIVGAFVYPKNKGSFNVSGEQVTLRAPINGLSAADITDGKIYFAVQAIEMVLIPYGPYYLGDGLSHHTFRSVPTRIIPADADIIGTDPNFSYFCIPMPYYQNAAPEHAADRVSSNGWDNQGNYACHISLSNHGAYDASHNTSWTVNFKSPKTIRTFGVASVNYTDVNGDYLPSKDWYLLGSNDSLVWDTLKRCTREMMVKDAVSYPVRHAIRVERPGSYQYYRVFFPEMNQGNNGYIIPNIAMSEQDLYPDSSCQLYVDSENAIPYGKILDGLYVDDGTTWSGSLPAAYPKGYKGFYLMKYELSQEQYVNFLNMLGYAQQKNRIGNNLDDLERGDYVFGDAAHPSCRNGIAVFSHKGSTQPVVFGNNLNPAEPFFAGDDGQTLACNYLTGPDMLAYLDWSGLRPLSELEYEKACRTPDRSLAGEYAWNTTGLRRLNGQSGLSASTMGTENETPSDLSVNANAANAGFGPVRCGAFGSSTSNQQQSGASFYGVMELSGNLGEMCYSVLGGSGLNVSSSNNEYHGDGVIASDGNHNVSGYWSGSSTTDMLSIRGGSFASPDSLLRVSDRSVLMNYDNSLRDSTVTFRGVRSISKSVDPGEISTDATCPGRVTIYSSRSGNSDADFSYWWYVKRPGSSVFELIEGEHEEELRDFEILVEGTAATVAYGFRRKVISLTGEAYRDLNVELTNTKINFNVSRVELDACNRASSSVIATAVAGGGTFNWNYGNVLLTEGITSANNTSTYLPTRIQFGQNVANGGVFSVECVYSVNGCSISRTVSIDIAEDHLSCPSFLQDQENNVYPVVKIGCQCWMAKNMNENRGTWWCYQGDCSIYGRLYDFSTANSICPSGWHLPKLEEWKVMTNSLKTNTAVKLKSASPVWNGTNETGFSAVPCGWQYNGSLWGIGSGGNHWTADPYWYAGIGGDEVIYLNNALSGHGFAVRCVKD